MVAVAHLLWAALDAVGRQQQDKEVVLVGLDSRDEQKEAIPGEVEVCFWRNLCEWGTQVFNYCW